MFLSAFLAVVLIALLVEVAFGYPDKLYARIGHPVTWAGALVALLDRRMNRPDTAEPARRRSGVAALAILLAAAIVPAWAVAALLSPLGMIGLLATGVLASSLLAQRSLFDHVARVADALETGGLEAGRQAVSQIVGRDPATLDSPAVCRAAIESLAENFSDGVTAPAFWLAALGLPGAAAYKAINTADSMIGHRTSRHAAFGWVSARLDDLVNLPASRLTAGLIVLAAPLAGGSARGAWIAVRRDARHHRSPNAGWPEAAMAGALGLRLAGPRTYGETVVDDAWMGDGRAEADPDDIRRALQIYRIACAILWGFAAVCLALMLALGR